MAAPTLVKETSIRPLGFEVTVVNVSGSLVSGWNPNGFVVIEVEGVEKTLDVPVSAPPPRSRNPQLGFHGGLN